MLGSVAQNLFEEVRQVPIAANTNLTAAFAASMARAGLGLALTYHTCATEKPDVKYIRIGQTGHFVELVLEYPAGGYRSRATRALDKLIHEILTENVG